MNLELEIESLYFEYDERMVLSDISFSISKGDFVSIIGPNGSGKSTLLKNLASILKPIKGNIKLEGKKIDEYRAKELARKMALVPQDTNVTYDFSVFDIVLMGRNPYLNRLEKEKQIDFQIVKDSLKLTNTLHLRDRNINEISGGERQRVIIARALAQEPEIILLDEPTSHLDINHQIEILSLLKKLNKEKKMMILLVIHDINLAARFSNKMILLNEGRVLSIGEPEAVITNQNMERAYNVNMLISHNPHTNSPYIIPLVPDENQISSKVRRKLHIICGGGSGIDVISRLDMMGHEISIGVINIGDSDWELGKKLSLNLIEEMPFNEIKEETFRKNIEAIKNADLVILTSVPYGNGNIKNLMAALKALELGKPVYLIDNYNKRTFDYTEGKASHLLSEMKKIGLKVVSSVDRLMEIL